MVVDPHAAQVVFESGVPLTMIPLDCTHRALMPAALTGGDLLDLLVAGCESHLLIAKLPHHRIEIGEQQQRDLRPLPNLRRDPDHPRRAEPLAQAPAAGARSTFRGNPSRSMSSTSNSAVVPSTSSRPSTKPPVIGCCGSIDRPRLRVRDRLHLAPAGSRGGPPPDSAGLLPGQRQGRAQPSNR